MRQSFETFLLHTHGPGLVEFTDQAAHWLKLASAQDGLLTLFCRHTSCSLLIQENADPSVQRDLLKYFERLAPPSKFYEHSCEGADDMPAHLRAALTQVHLSIPVRGGRMMLGAWQGLYLFEHRQAPHRREIAAHFIGTSGP